MNAAGRLQDDTKPSENEFFLLIFLLKSVLVLLIIIKIFKVFIISNPIFFTKHNWPFFYYNN